MPSCHPWWCFYARFCDYSYGFALLYFTSSFSMDYFNTQLTQKVFFCFEFFHCLQEINVFRTSTQRNNFLQVSLWNCIIIALEMSIFDIYWLFWDSRMSLHLPAILKVRVKIQKFANYVVIINVVPRLLRVPTTRTNLFRFLIMIIIVYSNFSSPFFSSTHAV